MSFIPQEFYTTSATRLLPAHEFVTRLGLSASIISIAQVSLTGFMKEILKEESAFSTYLNVITRSDDYFHFRFIELSAYLATHMANEMEAPSKNEYIDRVVFAAMFADITLRKSEWIHVRNADQLKGMNGATVKEINMHALKASEMVAGFSLAPKGAERVIKQHHGDLNGLGFSDAKDENICPLSKCLMVAQEVAYAILVNPKIKPRTVLADVVQRHRGKALFELLEKLEGRCCPHYADDKSA